MLFFLSFYLSFALSRDIYITSQSKCPYTSPLGTCEAPFCSISEAFSFDFSIYPNITELVFILMSGDNSFNSTSSLYFKNNTNSSIEIRGIGSKDCKNFSSNPETKVLFNNSFSLAISSSLTIRNVTFIAAQINQVFITFKEASNRNTKKVLLEWVLINSPFKFKLIGSFESVSIKNSSFIDVSKLFDVGDSTNTSITIENSIIKGNSNENFLDLTGKNLSIFIINNRYEAFRSFISLINLTKIEISRNSFANIKDTKISPLFNLQNPGQISFTNNTFKNLTINYLISLQNPRKKTEFLGWEIVDCDFISLFEFEIQKKVFIKQMNLYNSSIQSFSLTPMDNMFISFENCSFQSLTTHLFLNFDSKNNLTMLNVTFFNTNIILMEYFIYFEMDNNVTFVNFSYTHGYEIEIEDIEIWEDPRLIYFTHRNIFSMENSIIKFPNPGFGLLTCNYLNQIFLTQVLLEGFRAKYNGGVIYMEQYSNINVSHCYFINIRKLESESDLTMNGGVFHLDYHNNANLTDNLFYQVKIKYKGGTFSLATYNDLVIERCLSFESKGKLGGFGSMDFENHVTLKDSLFYNLSSEMHGGGFFLIEKNSITFEKIKIIMAFASENAGFLYLLIDNRLEAEETEVINSEALFSGGFIYAGSDNLINLTGFNGSEIRARLFGAGFYLGSGNTLDVTDSSLKWVLSDNNLFGFYLNCYNYLKISLSNFKESHGVFFSFYSSLIIENSSFENFKEDEKPFLHCLEGDIDVKEIMVKGFDGGFFYGKKCIASFKDISIKDSKFDNERGFFDMIKSSIKAISMKVKNSYTILLSIEDSNASLDKLQCSTRGYLVIQGDNSLISIINSRFKQGKTNQNLNAGFISLYNGNFTSISNEFIGGKDSSIYLSGITHGFFEKTSCLFGESKSFGGCLNQIAKCNGSLSVGKSIFMRNKGVYGGGIAIEGSVCEEKGLTARIEKSRFLLNEGKQGGGCFISNIKDFKLYNSYLQGNMAVGGNVSKGGGILIACEAKICKLSEQKVINVSFIGNKAGIGGGVYLEQDPKGGFKKEEKFFKNNKASFYGEDIATKPNSVTFFGGGNIFEINGLVSGGTYDNIFCILGIDYFGEDAFMASNLENQTEIYDLSKYKSKLLLQNHKSGLLCGSSTIVSNPRSHTQFNYNIHYRSYDSSLTTNLTLKISFRSCTIGERETDDFRCEVCPPGQYSFETNSSEKCKLCTVEDNFYCLGGSNISPKPGYWRFNNLSTTVASCPKPSSCLGSGKCLTGYKGILCSECQSGYGITNGNFCTDCSSAIYYFYLIGFFILRIGLLTYSLHRAVTMCASSAAGFLKQEEVISSTIIKILMNHFQVLNIIISFPFEWNRALFNMVSIGTGATPNISESFSWSCLFSVIGIDIHTQYLKIINLWLSILFLLSICYGYYRHHLNRKIRFYLKFIKKTEEDILESTFFIIMFICYGDFIAVALESFGCRNVGSDEKSEYRLVKDYSVVCYEGSHQGWGFGLVMPYLVIVGVGFPLMILFNLVYLYRKKGLFNKDSIIKYGFFYLSYENEYFYWDFVILGRKIVLTLVNTFVVAVYQTFFNVSVMIMFLILLIFLYLQVHCNPYQRKALQKVNILEKVSLISLSGTMFLAILSMQVTENFTAQTILLGSSLFFNIIFFGNWLQIYYQSDIRKTLRRLLRLLYMVLLFLCTKLKSCFERRPINSVRFEKRREGLKSVSSRFPTINQGNLTENEEELEKREGIRKKLLGNLQKEVLIWEHFSIENYQLIMKQGSNNRFTNAIQNPSQKSLVLRAASSLLKRSPKLKSLIEDVPIKSYSISEKPDESRKLLKGKTFTDESEDLTQTNEILKYKLDRASKEILELKLQARINVKSPSSSEKPSENEAKTEGLLLKELLQDNYYLSFIQKALETMTEEENIMAMIQNQGFLLKSRKIEVLFQIVLYQGEDKRFFLKYLLTINNMCDSLMENLWVLVKEHERIETIFPEISCLNMVPHQTIKEEIVISFNNLFLKPLQLDISYSLENIQYVSKITLPNSLWKLTQTLVTNTPSFIESWKSPLLCKIEGRKLNLDNSLISLKKLLLSEKVFKEGLLDLTPDEEEYEEELSECKYKKYGLLIKNLLTGMNYMIVLRLSKKKKSFKIQGKIEDIAEQKDKVFMDFLMSTIYNVFSMLLGE